MSKLEDEKEVQVIKQIVSGLRIPFEPFVKKVTKIYRNPSPTGFDFECGDTQGLIRHITLNLNFGYDNKSEVIGHIANGLAFGLSFRQVRTTTSIHFEIAKFKCNVHLDKVSVALERDAKGNLIYNVADLPQHLVTDHFNKRRIIAPNSKDGFVWGFRF